MSGSTPVLGLTLPGGGSQNKYGPPDVVDIDKLNEDLLKIDAAVGVPQVANNAALPSKPYLWQSVHVMDSDVIVSWNGANWVEFLPQRLRPSIMATTYYTQGQLGAGALDGRYFTEDELVNGGKLDGRYYTKTAADSRYVRQGAGSTFKIASGQVTASGFNLNSTTGRYFIGAPVVIPPGPLAGSNTVLLFGTALSQDPGGVFVMQDPDLPTGPGGGRLIVNRRNDFSTTINWFAIGF